MLGKTLHGARRTSILMVSRGYATVPAWQPSPERFQNRSELRVRGILKASHVMRVLQDIGNGARRSQLRNSLTDLTPRRLFAPSSSRTRVLFASLPSFAIPPPGVFLLIHSPSFCLAVLILTLPLPSPPPLQRSQCANRYTCATRLMVFL